MYRQGDVLIEPVPWVRGEYNNWMKVEKNRKGIILAEGEATGHHHRVKGNGVRTIRSGARTGHGRILLVPKGGATVTHEEHDSIALPPGAYEIKRQREYEPQAQRRERRVYD